MLRLISDSVPFEFIKNKMDADGNTRKYKDVYDFFKKVSAQSAEFSTAFSGAAFAASERNHQHHLSDTEFKGAKESHQQLRLSLQVRWCHIRSGLDALWQ